MKRTRKGGLVAAGIVGMALAVTMGLRSNTDADPAPPPGGRSSAVSVSVETASQGDIGVYLSSIGTVTPVYTATITSQVSGMIAAIHYREAQSMRKGDPLIDIDPRPYQAQLSQAEGVLERDTHVLEQSRMDAQRYRDAWARDAIARQQLDDQDKLVLQNEGTVKNDRGSVEYARTQLAYCHITAPFDGRVGLRLVDPGNVVQANSATPLVVLTQLQPITVIFTVAEDDLQQVQTELARGGRLRVDALDRAQSTTLATGYLVAVDNQINTATGTVRLRATFDNRNNALFPNQFVNTRLLVRIQHDAVLVPTSTIQHNGTTAFVYVIAGAIAHIRLVTTGVADGGLTAVTGLRPGDVVASSSFERLRDGVLVEVSQ